MIEILIYFAIPLITAVLSYRLKNLKTQYTVSLITSILHLGMTLSIFLGIYKPSMPDFFSTDSLSVFFLLVLSHIYFWIVLVSYTFLKQSVNASAQASKKYYFALLNFYLLSNTLALLSNHFGMYWVAVEATTLCVAPMIYYYRNPEALEAMWKYLFLVSIGIAVAFLGILFLGLSAQGTSLDGEQLFFSDFVKNSKELNPIWLKFSFICIFVGMSAKIGIAPLHYGDIDGRGNAPGPIGGLMSASLRITALMGVLRIFMILQPTNSFEFARTCLIIGGLLSIFIAFIFMFKVKNYKRLLAYSSVEHLGIITLGIGIGGIAFIGALYHILYNSINKVVMFLTAGKINNRYKTRKIEGVNSVLTFLPWTGWLFLLGFLALSAIPPFGMFFSELNIFEGILFSEYPLLIVIVMIMLLFIFINMGKHIFKMLYKKNESESSETIVEKFDIIHFASIVLLVLLTALALIAPQPIQESVLSISKEFGINI